MMLAKLGLWAGGISSAILDGFLERDDLRIKLAAAEAESTKWARKHGEACAERDRMADACRALRTIAEGRDVATSTVYERLQVLRSRLVDLQITLKNDQFAEYEISMRETAPGRLIAASEDLRAKLAAAEKRADEAEARLSRMISDAHTAAELLETLEAESDATCSQCEREKSAP